MTNRELYRFLGIAFLLAIVTQLIAVSRDVHGAGRTWLGLTMWAPTIAAFTASKASRRRARATLRRGGWRSFGYALLVGWSMLALQMLLLAVTRTGHWNTTMFPLAAGGAGIAGVHEVAMVLGVGQQGFARFALNLVVSVALGSIITAVKGGLGEEIGWRGVLQPEMERRLGPFRGTLAVGAIWAYWHIPANLAGYNDAAHPLLNTFVFFPIVVIAMAFGFAWLTKRSQSVWPAAIAHGANNTLSAGMLVVAGSWSADQVTFLAAAAIVATFLGWRLVKLSRRVDQPQSRSCKLPALQQGGSSCASR